MFRIAWIGVAWKASYPGGSFRIIMLLVVIIGVNMDSDWIETLSFWKQAQVNI